MTVYELAEWLKANVNMEDIESEPLIAEHNPGEPFFVVRDEDGYRFKVTVERIA